MEATFTPLELRLGAGEDIKMEAGPEIRAALQDEQRDQLLNALDVIDGVELPRIDDPTVRGTLEHLARALREATRACDALWYLAPEYDDGEPAE